MVPQEYSSAGSVIRTGPVGTHLTPHHVDVLIGSSAEGNPTKNEEPQSDEFGFGDRLVEWRLDRIRSVALTVASPRCFPFSASIAPRAPPSA